MEYLPSKHTPVKYSPDWLRSFKGCEHYSDQEATEVLQSLKILAGILLKNAAKNSQHVDSQCFLSLQKDIDSLKKAA